MGRRQRGSAAGKRPAASADISPSSTHSSPQDDRPSGPLPSPEHPASPLQEGRDGPQVASLPFSGSQTQSLALDGAPTGPRDQLQLIPLDMQPCNLQQAPYTPLSALRANVLTLAARTAREPCAAGSPEQPSLVAPLSAVRARALARSLDVPHADRGRTMREIQRTLLHDALGGWGYLAPFIASALRTHSFSGTPYDGSPVIHATILIQTACRGYLARKWLKNLKASVGVLQRWARRRTQACEPAMLVATRRQLAALLLVSAAISGGSILSSMLSTTTPLSPSLELPYVGLVTGILMASAAHARCSVVGVRMPEGIGLCVASAALSLKIYRKAWEPAPSATTVIVQWESGEKAFNYGVLFGLLPSSSRLRILCVALVAAMMLVMTVETERKLGKTSVVTASWPPALFAAGACSSSSLAWAMLRHVAQFEKSLGDLHRLLKVRRSDAADLDTAWREGPLLRIHLFMSQLALFSITVMYHLGYEHMTADLEVFVVTNLRGGLFAIVRILCMFALPKRIIMFWAKTHPPTHIILTHRAPILALMRSLWTTASAQLLMAQCFLLANFKSCASEGCLDETHEMCYEVPWLSTSSHPIPHTTGHGVSALILGVLLATSPLTPKWRILALLVATCAELHAVVFLSANAAEVERATTRAASAQWGFALAYTIVHNVLAATWKRSHMLARIEAHRLEFLRLSQTAGLRARLSLAKSNTRQPMLSAEPKTSAEAVPQPPEWLIELLEPPTGQACLNGQVPNLSKDGARRRSRGRRKFLTHGSFISSRSTHVSKLPSISEDQYFEESSEVLSFVGATNISNSYILNDSKFHYDIDGFLVPRETTTKYSGDAQS